MRRVHPPSDEVVQGDDNLRHREHWVATAVRVPGMAAGAVHNDVYGVGGRIDGTLGTAERSPERSRDEDEQR